jgi:hypothetical protein
MTAEQHIDLLGCVERKGGKGVFQSATSQAPFCAFFGSPVNMAPLKRFAWSKLGLTVGPGAQDMAKLATATAARIL